MNLDGPKFKKWFAEYYASGFHFGEDYEGIPGEVEDEIGLSPQEAYDLVHPPKIEPKSGNNYLTFSPEMFSRSVLNQLKKTKI